MRVCFLVSKHELLIFFSTYFLFNPNVIKESNMYDTTLLKFVHTSILYLNIWYKYSIERCVFCSFRVECSMGPLNQIYSLFCSNFPIFSFFCLWSTTEKLVLKSFIIICGNFSTVLCCFCWFDSYIWWLFLVMLLALKLTFSDSDRFILAFLFAWYILFMLLFSTFLYSYF